MAHEMAVGGGDATKLAHFFFVDSTTSLFRKNGKIDPLIGHRIFNPIDSNGVESVRDLVHKVAEKCPSGTKVGTLRIGAHGGNVRDNTAHYGFIIGADQIWHKTLPKYAHDLKKLNQYFIPGVTQVVLDSCLTGNDHGFLSELSKLWNGVAVTGFTQKQSVELPWHETKGEGPSVTCEHFFFNNCTRALGKY